MLASEPRRVAEEVLCLGLGLGRGEYLLLRAFRWCPAQVARDSRLKRVPNRRWGGGLARTGLRR